MTYSWERPVIDCTWLVVALGAPIMVIASTDARDDAIKKAKEAVLAGADPSTVAVFEMTDAFRRKAPEVEAFQVDLPIIARPPEAEAGPLQVPGT